MIITSVIEEVDKCSVVNCVLFLLAAPNKQRWRIITWPYEHNAQIEYTWSDLTDQADIIDIIKDIESECSFYQIEIPEELRNLFIFETEDKKKFRMRRLPMGWRPSAEILQILLQGLAAMAIGESSVRARIHVDNVFFHGNLKEVVEVHKRFIAICLKYRVTCGDIQLPHIITQFHSSVKFCNKCN
jgi:hypothetical protein